VKDFPISYRKEYDAQIASDEPVIGWRKKNNGIWVHTSVHDPHVDSAHNGDKTACKRGHKFTEANTIPTRTGRQCRTCKNQDRKPLTPEQKQRALELKRQRRRASMQQEESAA
jgi:hypothetical protein